MNYKVKIALFASLISAVATMADTIEIKDVGNKKLEAGKTAFVKTDKIPDSNLYAGYRIELEKKSDGKIHGRIATVWLEGYVELEDKKLSPITKFTESDFIINKPGENWIIIYPEKETKLAIRWIK
ncbi:MAG: hypothetical protein H2172_11640 [Opitutus sp.]|nr:hypothetical protein [Opitutus sp.]MCS6277000.1 hypothetical protein [Opitutus sp.]MCS6299952.1 hypothetical protein [Opitutus sp.]